LAEIISAYCPAGVAVVEDTVTLTLTGLLIVGLTLDDGENVQEIPIAGLLQVRSTGAANDPKAPS
jgi:hypothetical protein